MCGSLTLRQSIAVQAANRPAGGAKPVRVMPHTHGPDCVRLPAGSVIWGSDFKRACTRAVRLSRVCIVLVYFLDIHDSGILATTLTIIRQMLCRDCDNLLWPDLLHRCQCDRVWPVVTLSHFSDIRLCAGLDSLGFSYIKDLYHWFIQSGYPGVSIERNDPECSGLQLCKISDTYWWSGNSSSIICLCTCPNTDSPWGSHCDRHF